MDQPNLALIRITKEDEMYNTQKSRASAKPTKPYSERRGELLTLEEVADRLAVKERMVRRLVADGRLRPTKVGKHVRVHREDLEQYLDEIHRR